MQTHPSTAGNAPSQPVIRPWRPADQSAVWRLYAEGRLMTHELPGDEPRDLRLLVQTYFQQETNHFWVAEFNGRVVGMIGVRQLDRHAVEVRRLRVEISQRNSDLALRLVSTAVEHCRRQGVLKLVLNTRLARQTIDALLHEKGLVYGRQRFIDGKMVLEFYVNLYQKLHSDAPAGAGTTPLPPRLGA
jgi:GNAT superfamily N-acetyltransferase